MTAREPLSPQEIRDWMLRNYGDDYGVSDERLTALIGRAEAKREALGYGSVVLMAASWARVVQEGPLNA